MRIYWKLLEKKPGAYVLLAGSLMDLSSAGGSVCLSVCLSVLSLPLPSNVSQLGCSRLRIWYYLYQIDRTTTHGSAVKSDKRKFSFRDSTAGWEGVFLSHKLLLPRAFFFSLSLSLSLSCPVVCSIRSTDWLLFVTSLLLLTTTVPFLVSMSVRLFGLFQTGEQIWLFSRPFFPPLASSSSPPISFLCWKFSFPPVFYVRICSVF